MIIASNINRYISLACGIAILLMIVAPKVSVLLLISLFLSLGLINRKVIFIYEDTLLGALLGTLILWLIVSFVLFPDGISPFSQVMKVSGLIVLGFITCRLASLKLSHAIDKAYYIAAILGAFLGAIIICFAVIYIKITETSLWSTYFGDPLTTLNNSAAVIVLTAWPVLLILLRRSLAIMISIILSLFILLLFLSSLAAVLALVLGVAVLVIRIVGKRKSGVVLALIAAIFMLVFPYLIKYSPVDGNELFATHNEESVMPRSVYHRLAMWSFATEKIDEKPWLGWGFGASRHIPQEDRRLAPNMEIMPLHPHNLALQARLELGLPGSLILAGLVFSVFYRLATFTNDGWISGFAMAPAAGWLFVANVSYGMWQSWWIALAFLLAIFMKFALASTQRSVESPDTDL